jgi:hypothetical protein
MSRQNQRAKSPIPQIVETQQRYVAEYLQTINQIHHRLLNLSIRSPQHFQQKYAAKNTKQSLTYHLKCTSK